MSRRRLRLPLSLRSWFVGALLLLCAPAFSADPPAWVKDVAAFLETQRRDDGGYAWPDQAASHLTPTFAAVGTYQALGLPVPNADKAAAFVRDHHPQKGKKPEWELHEFDFQQIQALRWLKSELVNEFEPRVKTWTEPREYLARYEAHSYPPFQDEATRLLAREVLGLPTKDLPAWSKFLDNRRRANGSFNNTPASDGSDGHVLNTLWGLRAMKAMGREIDRKEETARWLKACQVNRFGHFAWQPGLEDKLAESSVDVIYTWAAVSALQLLGEKPADLDACLNYLTDLHHSNGGFADRVSWPANALATYYAVETLKALGFRELAKRPPGMPPNDFPMPQGPLAKDARVYCIQIEAPGAGSPADAVELARSLHIDLWGAKNAKAGWIEQAQKLAAARKVPVRFFVANEEYNTFFTVPGIGTFSHLSDVTAPPGFDFGASMTGVKPPPSWSDFLDKRIGSLSKAGGRMIYQFNENEPLARMLLDQSLANQANSSGLGFAAVSTFHFGQPDFINTYPYLWHYQHQLPQVALQDNHAAEPWFWAEQLEGFRTLFVATEPTWKGWLDAVGANRVVSVRHDTVSNHTLWIHGGDRATREFVSTRQPEWRWWREPLDKQPPLTARPMLSLAVLTPTDTFEAGRPEKGVAVRVRRRWQNTVQGLPKSPDAELVDVTVDGKPVEMKQVRVPAQGKKGPAGIADEYFVASVLDLPAGKHTATAKVKATGAGEPSAPAEQTVEFELSGR